MSVDVSAKLMVGREYGDLKEWIKEKAKENECDEYEVIEDYFEYASPWYDSGRKNWFIGFEAKRYGKFEDVDYSVRIAVNKFEKLTGLEPIIYATQHVY